MVTTPTAPLPDDVSVCLGCVSVLHWVCRGDREQTRDVNLNLLPAAEDIMEGAAEFDTATVASRREYCYHKHSPHMRVAIVARLAFLAFPLHSTTVTFPS